MIVLGIDPGTAATGYGIVTDHSGQGEPRGSLSLVECGVIRTAPRDGLSVRLCGLYDEMRAIIARHKPDVLAIEDVFYAKNVRTTVVLGHARGVLLLAAQQSGLVISEYPPAEIKKTVVGAGGATKEQVQFMVARLLRLKSAPQPNDAADGVAAALAHLLTARVPRLERTR